MTMSTQNLRAALTERSSLLAAIGNTPLFRLRRVTDGVPAGVEVYAKGEHLNPGGSVKDRAALAMILAGEQSGKLTPGKVILDATSGNTGIAYAMIGAALGYKVALCLPKNASLERKKILRAYGADIIETAPLEATDGAQRKARAMAAEEPEKFFYPDQYNNDANWRAHFEGTAPEIQRQTDGRVTHFIAGLGTSGTFIGTARGLRHFNPQVRCVSMQPDSPMHGLEGMKHMATALVPGIYDTGVADETVEVDTDDALRMMRRLAREEGLFVGVSAGGNVHAAVRLARRLPAGSVVVTILCDSGSRYLSEDIW
jgi:S-sulfo-L-cysteine synthase (O-acetyl-L-serine-dependent)